jgi:hypothetical protein
MKSRPLCILVGGKISTVPFQGGWTWVILQYVLGLKQLGYDVYFVEQLPKTVLPPGTALSDSVNAHYFRDVVSQFGLEDNSALIIEHTRDSVGIPYNDLRAIADRADVLLNVSGAFVDESLAERIPIRIYLDLDPAFTQLWHIQHVDMHLRGSTHFATVGLAMGMSGCDIPTCGADWIPICQPVVLNYWPVGDGLIHDALTTVANWRGYGSIVHNGVFYGQKAHSLRQLIGLPNMTSESLLLALSIHADEQKDLAALESQGWGLIDPARVASTPWSYRQFVQGSKAEFGIAKSGYVAAQCGWFSDRSACYLASGRPVIAQDTGFSRFLPTGEGLFAFNTEDDVLAAIDALRSDYGRHSRAARSLALEFFDSRKVLTHLLQKTGAIQ